VWSVEWNERHPSSRRVFPTNIILNILELWGVPKSEKGLSHTYGNIGIWLWNHGNIRVGTYKHHMGTWGMV
jgi:hypothetical protein